MAVRCVECRVRKTIPLPDKNFGQVRLQHFNYSAEDLVKRFTSINDPSRRYPEVAPAQDPAEPKLNRLETNALEVWKEIRQSTLNISDDECLQICFTIFDDYFCAGALRGLVDVHWAEQLIRNGHTLLGNTEPIEPALHTVDRLMVSIARHDEKGSSRSDVAYLSTLLHEMAHCIIALFQWKSGCLAPTMGLTGHGPTWVQLAKVLEDAANKGIPVEREIDSRTEGVNIGMSGGQDWDLGIKVSEDRERQAVDAADLRGSDGTIGHCRFSESSPSLPGAKSPV